MKPLIFLTYSVIKEGILNNYFFILLMKNFSWASKNDFWASRCWLQLFGQAVKLIFFAPCVSQDANGAIVYSRNIHPRGLISSDIVVTETRVTQPEHNRGQIDRAKKELHDLCSQETF